MSAVYWHELSDAEAKAVLESGITIGEFTEKYSQPEWCEYMGALEGKMGCWTLVDINLRKKISRRFCKSCDCYIKKDDGKKEGKEQQESGRAESQVKDSLE